MNICMFAKGLPVHITGGMEIHVKELAEGLVRRGHKVTIITTRHPKGIEKEETNLKIYYVGDKPLKYTTKEFREESVKLFLKLNEKENFDLVHSQSGAGVWYALKCKKIAPLIITFHGIALNEAKSLRNTGLIGWGKGMYILVRDFINYHVFNHKLFFERADKIIAVSNELAEDIKRQYKVPEGKLIVIPNGIDISKFKPMPVDDLREKLGLADEKVIVSVGAISKQKGFHLLLKILPDILREYKNMRLIIVGTGPYLQKLKDMAVKLGIENHVIFAGRVSDEELPKYYNLADVFAFPTLRMEGLPLVVPEAMACEKPVIASRIGGIPTVIENNKDGILIEPGNLKELKERIMEVLRDEELAKKLGKNARKKVVERFSLDRMVEDTIKVYKEVLGCWEYAGNYRKY